MHQGLDLSCTACVLQWAFPFKAPVDTTKWTTYLDVVKTPMDFGTIKRRLETGAYASPEEFATDMRLVFSNAKTFNPAGSDVEVMAGTLKVQQPAVRSHDGVRTCIC